MPTAGWCAQCGANVWLVEDGSCPAGHDASQISNTYEAEQPEKDAFAQAADGIEDVATQTGEAVKGAWDSASPAAKEAADSAGEAAGKAADAAKDFGKKLWDHGKKRGSSDADIDD